MSVEQEKAIADAIQAERNRIMEIVMHHFRYWSHSSTKAENFEVEVMAIAAMGAIANIQCEIITNQRTLHVEA